MILSNSSSVGVSLTTSAVTSCQHWKTCSRAIKTSKTSVLWLSHFPSFTISTTNVWRKRNYSHIYCSKHVQIRESVLSSSWCWWNPMRLQHRLTSLCTKLSISSRAHKSSNLVLNHMSLKLVNWCLHSISGLLKAYQLSGSSYWLVLLKLHKRKQRSKSAANASKVSKT